MGGRYPDKLIKQFLEEARSKNEFLKKLQNSRSGGQC